MRFLRFTPSLLMTALLWAGAAPGAGKAVSCAKDPLNLDLKIHFTEHLRGRDQHLSVRTASSGAMVVRNAVTGDTLEVAPARCAEWRQDMGKRIAMALERVRREPAAQEQSIICDRLAIVETKGNPAAKVCLSMTHATVRGRAFRDLYESLEGLMVLP